MAGAERQDPTNRKRNRIMKNFVRPGGAGVRGGAATRRVAGRTFPQATVLSVQRKVLWSLILAGYEPYYRAEIAVLKEKLGLRLQKRIFNLKLRQLIARQNAQKRLFA